MVDGVMIYGLPLLFWSRILLKGSGCWIIIPCSEAMFRVHDDEAEGLRGIRSFDCTSWQSLKIWSTKIDVWKTYIYIMWFDANLEALWREDRNISNLDNPKRFDSWVLVICQRNMYFIRDPQVETSERSSKMKMELRHEEIWFWNVHFSFTHISYICLPVSQPHWESAVWR